MKPSPMSVGTVLGIALRAVRTAASVLLLIVSQAIHAHPGALDDTACHRNRSAGDYHCHPSVSASADDKASVRELRGRVVGVTDGDTIKVLDVNNVVHKVRLQGIDAPEKVQPFGNTSRKHLERMVAGQQVLVRFAERDKYGRILGGVWAQPRDCPRCANTLFVNHAQILAGMAWWYRYYADEQSEADRAQFESAEREAIARKSGLWADPNPVPPWVWRRR